MLSGISYMSMTAAWFMLSVFLFIVEAAVPGLISIWFGIGAFAAMFAAALKAPALWQVIVFAAVSVLTLALTRPFATKYVNGKAQPTNAETVIGHDCIVVEAIDNTQGTGQVKVDGKVWTARLDDPAASAEVGDHVTAIRIEGVKLIVAAKADNVGL